MAIPPGGLPPMPPHIAAMLSRGSNREALKKGAVEISKEIARKGPRIIKPIAKLAQTGLRGAGMFAEAEEVAIFSTEAEVVLFSEQMIAILETLMSGAGVVAEAASPFLPVLMIGLGCMFLMSLNSKPAAAEPLKREYRNLHREIKMAIDRRKHSPSIYDIRPGKVN